MKVKAEKATRDSVQGKAGVYGSEMICSLRVKRLGWGAMAQSIALGSMAIWTVGVREDVQFLTSS
jgi:hypothetical protein